MRVCIPTLNRYDLLTKCIESLNKGSLIPEKIIVINNGIQEYKEAGNIKVVSFGGNNLGVAASWNWFLKNVNYPLLICNDDLEFSYDDLKLFEEAYYNEIAYNLFWSISLSQMNMFSCFAPTYTLISTVGYFDETFYPAYFEDNDYFYRMSLAGIEHLPLSTNIKHFGSATLKNFDRDRKKKHDSDFNKNKEYYKSKWGGLPHKEIWKKEFNR